MIRIEVDGARREVAGGGTILDALAGAPALPALCHDPRIAPAAVCRLCLVEVRGEARPVPACATPVRDGMAIATSTPALDAARDQLLALLAARQPPAPERGPGDPFLDLLRARGLEGALGTAPVPAPRDASHPYLHVDLSRCIDCWRCVRICAEVQGQFTWRILGRGAKARPAPDAGVPLRESSCVGCGACADSCPTGAIEDASVIALGRPATFVRTVCPYCGVGCELDAGVRDGKLVQVKPPLDAKVNRGHLCVKGRYAFGYVGAADRPTSPKLRTPTGLHDVSWDEALSFVADRLARIRDVHGPGAIGVLGSARGTNEEAYLTQKLARVALGTNSVDCCARVCHAPSAAALGELLGAGAATSSFDDIERARTLLVVGANPTANHPVVGARLKQAALRGARLVVIDPRVTELAARADVHLRPRPGTDLVLLHALASAIVEAGLVDEAFVRDRVDGLDEHRRFLAAYPPERAARDSGGPAALVRRAARLYAGERPSLAFHGLGATEQVQGTATVKALVNLALLTGNVGVPGAGVNPLRGQNNVQGAAHMGCEPRHLTGYATVDAGRALHERVWGARLPAAPGLDLLELVDAAEAGAVRALYAIGYDVALTNPEAARTRAALGKLELLVVQDPFFSETAQLADVFLPVSLSYEKDGTFMNAERRVQRVRRVVAPPAGVRTDLEVLCELGARLGHGGAFAFRSAREVWEEIRRVWPAGAGITYERLEAGGLQWPCPTEDHPGTAILHADRFASGPRARLSSIEAGPPAETCDEAYPLVLVTGRRLYQFNAATMSGRTPNQELQPEDLVDVSPADAAAAGLAEGDRAVVESRRGAAILAVRVSAEVRPGEVFATFHTAEAYLNRVIGPARDAVTRTPAYKVTAVRLRRV